MMSVSLVAGTKMRSTHSANASVSERLNRATRLKRQPTAITWARSFDTSGILTWKIPAYFDACSHGSDQSRQRDVRLLSYEADSHGTYKMIFFQAGVKRVQALDGGRCPPYAGTCSRPGPIGGATTMDILGIGTDIIECPRIGKMIEHHGELFLRRVYTEREIRYCQARKHAIEHFAGRWAAKEAIVKALGTGRSHGIAWTNIEIRNDKGGRPRVMVCGPGQGNHARARDRRRPGFDLTLPHLRDRLCHGPRLANHGPGASPGYLTVRRAWGPSFTLIHAKTVTDSPNAMAARPLRPGRNGNPAPTRSDPTRGSRKAAADGVLPENSPAGDFHRHDVVVHGPGRRAEPPGVRAAVAGQRTPGGLAETTSLTIQATGLSGHLDEFWPDLKDSAWTGAGPKDGSGARTGSTASSRWRS